ncbi:MAG: DNA-processing protein DprA [Clostridia bacterium]|nr:DNA-processing protein DprA [Clostridia bacterium]
MLNLRQKVCLVLSTLAPCCANKQKQLIDLFQHPEDMWSQLESRRIDIESLVGASGYSRLKYSLREDFVRDIENDLSEKNIIPITYYSKEYPEKLANIYDAPMTLFCMGDVSLLSSDCLGVVGTRKMSAYGKRVTTYFVSELATKFTIVSGLAYGVDTMAHITTLDTSGRTIAVLGSGLLNIYPSSNISLAKEIIAKGGLIISEHQSYTEPSHYNFPLRNRIISGLSKGILITEAPEKSGVFSTFEYALEQGREVFVVPGDIFDSNYKGSNMLIKRTQGALVTTPKDIYDSFYMSVDRKKVVIQLDMDEQAVVQLLQEENKLHFDQLIKMTSINAGTLNYTLSNLELKGLVIKLQGNYYQYTYSED